ncbi:MAG: zinc-binding dehydrogenase [Crocinitomicaceae bacterium]
MTQHENGADQVIDCQLEDFTEVDQKFDFIFDVVRKSSFGACKPRLKKKGIYASTELGKGGQNIFLTLLTPLFFGRKVIFPIPLTKKKDIEFLAELAQLKAFTLVIDRTYPFDDIIEAYRYVESGQKNGECRFICMRKLVQQQLLQISYL